MWNALKAKFEIISQIHKDLAIKHLESTKLAKSRDLFVYLYVLTKHQATANAIRYNVEDLRMISIILTLLSLLWIILV